MELLNTREKRSRFIETLWLMYAFFLIGFDNGILGPVLLDLQYIVGVGLDTISNLFIVTGVGFILGIIISLVVEKYVNIRLFLAISLLLGSVINILLPITSSFIYIVFMSLFQGIMKGFVDFGILTLCKVLWNEDKAFSFQLVSVGGAVAAFIAPFIAEPFLSSRHVVDNRDSDLYDPCHNITAHIDGNECFTYDNTNIQGAYIILGVITLPPALSFLYFYRLNKPQSDVPYEEFSQNNSVKFSNLSSYSIVFMILLFLFHIPVFGFCLAFGDLLEEFGVKSDFRFSKSTMAFMTAVFWGSFVVGRVVNLVFSRYYSLFIVLIVNFSGLLCGVLFLVLSTSNYSVTLWLGTVLIGIFSSTYLPAVMVWSDGYIPITSFVISASLVASGIGEMIIPLIGGKIFITEGPYSLMILMLVTVLCEISIFMGLVAVGNRMLHNTETV